MEPEVLKTGVVEGSRAGGTPGGTAVGTVEVRKGRAGQFKEGNGLGGKPKKLSSKRVPVLQAMRQVVSDVADVTYQHKELRAWLKTSKDSFMKELMRLESAEMGIRIRGQRVPGKIQAAGEELRAAPVVEEDESLERSLELVRRLLAGGDDVIAGTGPSVGAEDVSGESEVSGEGD